MFGMKSFGSGTGIVIILTYVLHTACLCIAHQEIKVLQAMAASACSIPMYRFLIAWSQTSWLVIVTNVVHLYAHRPTL